MSKFYDQTPAGADGMMRRLQSLEREVRELRAARRLEAASIGRGGITIEGGAVVLKDSDGNEIARLGGRDDLPPGPDGNPQPGFILRRADGTIAFTLDDPNGSQSGEPLKPFWKLQDASGNIIFSEDANAGWGMSNPILSYPMHPGMSAGPEVTTTGTTFATIWQSYVPAYHASYNLSAWAYTTTPGLVIRFMVNGVQQGSQITVPANTNGQQLTWSVDGKTVAGTPGTAITFEIQAYRTLSSTGVGRIAPLWLLGGM